MAIVTGRPVGRIGFGLMGLTWTTNAPSSYAECIKVMKAALDRGANFWNGGEFYGPPEANSLQLLRAYFTEYPEDADKVVLSIKGGLRANMMPDGSEEGLRASVENCLNLLGGTKSIDIFECARVDPQTPIEDTVRALAKLQQEGKIGGIGLSEVRAETVSRAAAVAPIACVEVEVSLTSREPVNNGTVRVCSELGIPIAAYSPLCRGLLTGKLRSLDQLPEADGRRHGPMFQQGALETNLKLVDAVSNVAKRKGCTPAQVAVAWAAAQSTSAPVIPIPGASSVERVEENLTEVQLNKDEMEEIMKILNENPTEGGRYPAAVAALSEY